MKDKEFLEEDISASALLQKIKSGEINPRSLKMEERQACVNILILHEGLKYSQAAQLLGCSEKTIGRDVSSINRKNSIRPSLELAEDLVGRMMVKAEIHISHLMRLSRSQDGSVSERAQAEFFAWKIRVDLMTRLQTLGYLPLVPQRIEGDLFHHESDSEEENDLAELKKVLNGMEITFKETGTLDAETEGRLKDIKSKIEKAEIELEIENLKKKQDKTQGGENEANKK